MITPTGLRNKEHPYQLIFAVKVLSVFLNKLTLAPDPYRVLQRTRA